MDQIARPGAAHLNPGSCRMRTARLRCLHLWIICKVLDGPARFAPRLLACPSSGVCVCAHPCHVRVYVSVNAGAAGIQVDLPVLQSKTPTAAPVIGYRLALTHLHRSLLSRPSLCFSHRLCSLLPSVYIRVNARSYTHTRTQVRRRGGDSDGQATLGA